ncbi:hypothetical protein [Streptomyces sp. KN37]|uniref:hypothetical protein n=1 Tax=Streptomyces sp. KN37 TaxID=3090667 RepID=UPI002A762DEC|nr:hypothetical protein [Streptomyces sp. KN37]WPO69931.1 hypothetical protein R9806_04440 [Streptomyces sp. KN37]
MNDSPVLRWPLPAGNGFACPACGLTDGVTVALDLEDHSGDPSYMRCPDGHLWPEPAFPRLLGATMLRNALAADPDFLIRMAPLSAALDRPRATGWLHLPEGASGPSGRAVACPECGATRGLAAEYDSHVFDEEPSRMRCLSGHQWLEDEFPRWVAAAEVQKAVDLDGRD